MGDGVGEPVGKGDGVSVMVTVLVGEGGMVPPGLGVGLRVKVGEGAGDGVIVTVAVGEGGMRVGIPKPLSATCWGLFLAESVNVTAFWSLTLPTWVGLNRTSTSQKLPASNAPVHPSFCIMKGGEATTLVKVIEADLELLVAL
ncbi:MAG: hypothetical protein WBQ86_15410, partial [Candidatus Binatus sp.]